MLTEQIRICKYNMYFQNMLGHRGEEPARKEDMLCLLGYTTYFVFKWEMREKDMGRGILAVGPHVDFQSLQRWVHGQMPKVSCCLKYERTISRQLPAGACAYWWQVRSSDKWKASNVFLHPFLNQVWGSTHWTLPWKFFFLIQLFKKIFNYLMERYISQSKHYSCN